MTEKDCCTAIVACKQECAEQICGCDWDCIIKAECNPYCSGICKDAFNSKCRPKEEYEKVEDEIYNLRKEYEKLDEARRVLRKEYEAKFWGIKEEYEKLDQKQDELLQQYEKLDEEKRKRNEGRQTQIAAACKLKEECENKTKCYPRPVTPTN